MSIRNCTPAKLEIERSKFFIDSCGTHSMGLGWCHKEEDYLSPSLQWHYCQQSATGLGQKLSADWELQKYFALTSTLTKMAFDFRNYSEFVRHMTQCRRKVNNPHTTKPKPLQLSITCLRSQRKRKDTSGGKSHFFAPMMANYLLLQMIWCRERTEAGAQSFPDLARGQVRANRQRYIKDKFLSFSHQGFAQLCIQSRGLS